MKKPYNFTAISSALTGVTIFSLLFIVIPARPDVAVAYELRNIERGEMVPGFTLPQVSSGQKYHFSPGQGKPAALFFFSIAPDFRKNKALALLAELASLSANYKNKVQIIAIFSDDQDKKTVKDYLKTLPVPLPVLYDGDQSVYNQFGVFMMPLVLLVSDEGTFHAVLPYTYGIREMIHAHLNFLLGEWDETQLKEALKPKENIELSKEEKEYIRRVNYGRVMASKKMYSQALREFTTAMKLQPEKPAAYIGAGFVHIFYKKWDKAESLFQKALKLDHDSDDAIAGLGLSFFGRKDIDAALPKLENAFISPQPRLEVILALAEIHEKRGDYEKAIRLNKLAVSRLMVLWGQRWK